ncbi:Ras-related protein RABA5b [Hibiscus syriacus]|uniref:Ras-related protein RABA5b n=1 Tax=Hibiscus syriacus TaxID=106335 RepID=A0A6A3BQ91_HIBSY|nr:Ras-related protein RABA5b [Hibiscus syriacus]
MVLTLLFIRCVEFVLLLLRCRRLSFPAPLKMEGRRRTVTKPVHAHLAIDGTFLTHSRDMGGHEEEGEGEEYLFKIVLIGDSVVGKSNLLSCFARNEFDNNSKATIRVEFRAVTPAYYRDVVGALIVYDISRRSNFDRIKRWLDELTTHCDTTVTRILVGNKCDLENIREVSVEEGKSLDEEEGLFFMETSALESTNVQTSFEIVIQEIYTNVSRKALNSDAYKDKLFANRVKLKDGVNPSKEVKKNIREEEARGMLRVTALHIACLFSQHGINRQMVLTLLLIRYIEFVVLLLRCRRLPFPAPFKMEGRRCTETKLVYAHLAIDDTFLTHSRDMGGHEKEGGVEEYLFKILLIGDSVVGKSNLLSHFARNEFDNNSKATIGVEKLKHRSGTLLVKKGSELRSSFDSIKRWLDELTTHCDTTVTRMLVGNKCDLENIREVSMEEGKSLAEEEGLFFIETSALESTNVQTAFEIVIREIYTNVSRKALNSDAYKGKLSANRVKLKDGVNPSKKVFFWSEEHKRRRSRGNVESYCTAYVCNSPRRASMHAHP